MEDLDVNTKKWRIFMSATLKARVHLGKDYSENLHSTKNQAKRTVRHLFDVTKKFLQDQTETSGLAMIDWQQQTWQRTTLLTDNAVRVLSAENLPIF